MSPVETSMGGLDRSSRDADSFYRAIAENAPDGILVRSHDEKVLFANAAFLRLVGARSLEDIVAMNTRRFFEPEMDSVMEDCRRRLASGEKLTPHKLKLVTLDGTPVPVENHSTIIEWAGKSAVLAIYRDVSDRERQAIALKESERQYSTLVQKSPDGIVVLDPEDRIIFANDSMLRIAQVDRADQIVGSLVFDHYHPEDLSRIAARRERFREGETLGPALLRFIRADGSFASVEAFPVRIQWEGRPASLVFFHDTTDRSLAEAAVRESETRYRALSESSPDGIFVVDPDGLMLFANAAFARMFGEPDPDQLLGLSIDTIVHPDERDRISLRREKTLDDGFRSAEEIRILARDGTVVPVESVASRIEWNGSAAALVVYRDLTDRKIAERAVLESEERYRALVENSPVGIAVVGSDRRIIFVNDTMVHLAGVRDDAELIGKRLIDQYHPSDRPLLEERRRRSLAGEVREPIEVRLLRPDGSVAYVEASPVDIEWQGAPAVLVVYRDNTERHAAQEALRESERRYRLLSEQSPEGIYVYKLDGEVVFANPALAELLCRRSFDELLGIDAIEIIHADDRPNILKRREALARGEKLGFSEVRYSRADGSAVSVEASSARITWDGQPAILVMARDLTERKKAEEELRKAFFAMDHAALGIYWIAPDGRLIYVNQKASDMLGFERSDLIGVSIFDIDATADTNDAAIRWDEIRRVGSRAFETLHRSKSGIDIPVEVQAYFVAFGDEEFVSAFSQDITERKRVEAELTTYRQDLEKMVQARTLELQNAHDELLRSARLAGIGQLTATVSQELSNPLGMIHTAAYALRSKLLDPEPGVVRIFDRLDRNIRRCVNIIDDLLDYTRTRDLELSPTDIDPWLTEVLHETRIPDGIVVITKMSARSVVWIDRERLHQAISNVITNAVQAMAPKSPSESATGAITLVSERDAERVSIRVTDSGPGIEDDVVERIFEPLFSTKGFGVGLGLPLVKRTLEQHGGGVDVATEVGHGTTMTIWLPLANTRRDAAPPRPAVAGKNV